MTPTTTARVRRLSYSTTLVAVGLLYLAYVGFIALNGRGAVDYETFMGIGHRFRLGEPVWTTNSYYPLPYVLIFAFFDALPRVVGILIWHLAPVVAALVVTRGRPWPLLFAPLFAHVLGGQTALWALVGLAIYRSHRDDWRGGIGLALLLLKPQLAVFPLVWAACRWLQQLWTDRRLPAQAGVLAALALLIYLPGFFLIPDWVSRWLSQPRPLFERALAGLLPRSLYLLLPQHGAGFWLLLVLLAVGLLAFVVWRQRGRLTFDAFMLWSFVVNPFVHDYDLIQMLPLLDTHRLRRAAVLASLPLWAVIFFAYTDDRAWFVATLIAPVVLLVYLRSLRA